MMMSHEIIYSFTIFRAKSAKPDKFRQSSSKVTCNKIVVLYCTFIGEVFLPGWVGGRLNG